MLEVNLYDIFPIGPVHFNPGFIGYVSIKWLVKNNMLPLGREHSCNFRLIVDKIIPSHQGFIPREYHGFCEIVPKIFLDPHSFIGEPGFIHVDIGST